MNARSLIHATVIGEPDMAPCRTWDNWGGRLAADALQATCPECRESWPYAVAQRRAAIPDCWQPVSVEPAADFGNGHGLLAVSDSGQPGSVVIEQADRVIYIPDEWVGRAAAGDVPWAEIGYLNPWHKILRIRGTDRTVIYDQAGTCGPRVQAIIFEQPD